MRWERIVIAIIKCTPWLTPVLNALEHMYRKFQRCPPFSTLSTYEQQKQFQPRIKCASLAIIIHQGRPENLPWAQNPSGQWLTCKKKQLIVTDDSSTPNRVLY